MSKSRFIVEVLYNQVYVSDASNGEKDSKVVSHQVLFEGENRSSTMQDAKAFLEKTVRHGLELSGGSIIKSVISPSAIMQVGVVDQDAFEKEMELMEAQRSASPTDVENEAPVEGAPVDSTEDAG